VKLTAGYRGSLANGDHPGEPAIGMHLDRYGGQGRNRTTDTRIFKANKINKLWILLD
jgi:hypothetical protein